jgi:hypothetical protein
MQTPMLWQQLVPRLLDWNPIWFDPCEADLIVMMRPAIDALTALTGQCKQPMLEANVHR